jgi:Mrp family chromosome partitioning ATPase
MAAGKGSERTNAISRARFQTVLQFAMRHYDMVIVDLPAANDDASVFNLAGLLDGVAIVVEAERVHWQAGLRTLARLRQSGAHLIGAVLNKRPNHIPDWLYRVL